MRHSLHGRCQQVASAGIKAVVMVNPCVQPSAIVSFSDTRAAFDSPEAEAHHAGQEQR